MRTSLCRRPDSGLLGGLSVFVDPAVVGRSLRDGVSFSSLFVYSAFLFARRSLCEERDESYRKSTINLIGSLLFLSLPFC